jgi:FtsP/CotA-like multicopper oxidase with cupredoxin domain
MERASTRREFLNAGPAVAATLAAVELGANSAVAADAVPQPASPSQSGQSGQPKDGYPRDRPGPGGPVGSATDRGKLVPGLRQPTLPPVPVETPDLAKLPWTIRNGAKEFHLIAMPVKRELLPNLHMDVWGFNGSMPGPMIEVNQGDTVRIIVENRLPEYTSIHWHSLEVPVSQDGVPGLVQDFIPPGEAFVYEFYLHQHGTFFYHAHVAMQEAMGMVGLFIIHPKTAYEPVVDQDFGLISQEFSIMPNTTIPNSQGMDFNFLTFNGHCAPLTTPLVVKLGHRVRLRIVNFSTADHHPIHLHGHTWWVTGTEGGRIPESAWVPGNNVLVGVAQARDVEFIANNPGDWIMHCHMFHHTMNHMVSMAGPMMRVDPSDKRGRVPGYPQNMESGMKMDMGIPEEDPRPLAKREARGMRRDWSHIKGLTTVVRVLPPDLYDRVMSGTELLPPGSSIFGPKPGRIRSSEAGDGRQEG